MRIRLALSTTALMLALAGCAATASPDSAPTTAATPAPTSTRDDKNEQSCSDFADVTQKFADIIGAGDSTVDEWDAAMAELDRVGLAAEGDVKDRILAITSNPPSFGDVLFGETTLVEDMKRVNRACGW